MAKNRSVFRKVLGKIRWLSDPSNYKEIQVMTNTSQENKAKLWDKFVGFYAKDVPFGSMPKTNTDAFVYGLLEESGYFKECKTAQDIAVKLKITPAKVRNLMYKSALYNGFEVNDYTTKILECLGSSATFIKNNYISLCIDDSRVKASLQMICANNKILTDESFNEEILIFPIKDYAKLLESFIPTNKENELKSELLTRAKDVKWDITAQQIAEHPILKILEKGAAIATGGSSEIIPTDIVVKAIVKIMKIKEKMKKSK